MARPVSPLDIERGATLFHDALTMIFNDLHDRPSSLATSRAETADVACMVYIP